MLLNVKFNHVYHSLTEEANRILENESHLYQLPHNLPTIESIDAGRNKSK